MQAVAMAEILSKTTIGDLVIGKGNLLCVPDVALAHQVVDIMREKNIMSIPVAALARKMPVVVGENIAIGSRQFAGIVSILDVVLHLVDHFSRGEECLKDSVMTVLAESEESRAVWELLPDTTLLGAMEPFSKGVHRFLVPVKGQSTLQASLQLKDVESSYRMLTQTDMIKFLVQKTDFLGPVVGETLTDLGLLHPDVLALALPADMALIDALRLMRQHGGFYAAPIVTPTEESSKRSPSWVRGGKLVGTLSMSDFRGLNGELIKGMNSMNVMEFLNKVQSPAKPPVTCRPMTPLATAMATAVTSWVHRVWVTDEDGWLLGVLTFSDIIGAVRRELFRS